VPHALYGIRALLRKRRVTCATGGEFRSLLEVGCGDATFLRYLDRTCPPSVSLVGVDLQAPRIDQGRLQVTCGDFDSTAVAGTFDAVVMFNVLEHLPDPVSALRKIREKMAAGGVLYGEVPNWNSAWRRKFPRHWQGLQIPRHMTQFEPATLRRTLEREGFEAVRIRKLFDPGDLCVTICNLITDRLKLQTPPRQAWFFMPVVLTTAPIDWLISVVSGNAGSLEFTARRGD